jgi:hypothetical protein
MISRRGACINEVYEKQEEQETQEANLDRCLTLFPRTTAAYGAFCVSIRVDVAARELR